MRPLTRETATWLTSPEALAGIAETMHLPLQEQHTIATLTSLQKKYSPDQAAALLDQARLRIKARTKFGESADRMLFTDEALQQASGTSIATYRANRYAPFGGVVDLGCGIGGDAIALSHVTPKLLALDLDPVRVILAHFNLNAVGRSNTARVIQTDWTTYTVPPGYEAGFADPARRSDERRIFSLYEIIPPIGEILKVWATLPHLGVKVMPGVPDDEIPPVAETEWISEGGVCKEGILWFGSLRTGAARTATIVTQTNVYTLSSATPAPALSVTPPRTYLYEPDPAIIRATLVAQAALPMGASQLDPQIAYLTGDMPVLTPFLRGWQVLVHAPFNLKILNRMIRDLDGNVVAVKKRGSPIEPEPFRKRLKSNPAGRALTVFLTRHHNEPYMIICGTEIKA